MSKTVGIIGLGLLGGSLAKALKEYTDYEVVGYARRQEVCDAAIQDGVVKAAWTEVEDPKRVGMKYLIKTYSKVWAGSC